MNINLKMDRKNKGPKRNVDIKKLSFIQTKLKNMKVTKENKEINILLLGETGVGKSTFINAFFNYITFSSVNEAVNENLQVVIPSKFTVSDENYEERTVSVGEDHNENVEVGKSATQACRSYVYLVEEGGLKIRFIDTPGIGDTRGIERDNINFENILSFIGELDQLNAICILLKPNNSRLTVMFEFCIKQLLSKLEKSASQNLIFVFTNTRSTFYRPGETLPLLRNLLSTITVEIPIQKSNIFCTDNESFRFLVALKNGIQFSSYDVSNFSQSWILSTDECLRMLTYIIGDADKVGLTPHNVRNTVSINEARRLIIQMSKPLADIAHLISCNIRAIDIHQQTLKMTNVTLSELTKKLYIPIVDLTVTRMNNPTTVCTSPKCSIAYEVGDNMMWHYKQKCHDSCALPNIPKEIIGSPQLLNCKAINSNGECNVCSCSYKVHMHIYYETKSFQNKVEDKIVGANIKSRRAAYRAVKELRGKMTFLLSELRIEEDLIIKSTATFACFLKTNAIAPYTDAFKAYLEFLIDREKSITEITDYDLVKLLNNMLLKYTEEKNKMVAQVGNNNLTIVADDIMSGIESLYSMKHYGSKIKELIEAQKTARTNENKSQINEFVYRSTDVTKKARPLQSENVKNPFYQQAASTSSDTFPNTSWSLTSDDSEPESL